MTEAEWLACRDARDLITAGPVEGFDRKLRLLAVACCRCSRMLLANRAHRAAVDLAERYADGRATDRELEAEYRRANRLAGAMNKAAEKEREIRRWAEATAVANATKPFLDPWGAAGAAADAIWQVRRAAHRDVEARLEALVRDVFGNPFRPVALDPAWLTSDVLALARGIYDDRAFDRLPILADALQDAGCDSANLLNHLRDPGEHVRGCWAVDLVLGL